MEILDLYDKSKNLLPKTIERDLEPSTGEYRLAIHVWILNSDNKFLIQKRSPNIKRNPGKWGFTGGAVDSTETSLDGAVREIKEELGLDVIKNDLDLLITYRRKYAFFDVFVIRKDIDITNLLLQEEEVTEVKWSTIDEIKEMIDNNSFVKSAGLYMDLFNKLLEENYYD